MFPFWEDVIAPFIDTVRPRRVIEIGALRGETTVRMLERLGGECELHVIDPLPQFDPATHEKRFPGRYIFHRGLSHDVLPILPPADVALVDGDHNWFTVYHELRMLAATAREASAPLPLLILHDVGWPYGRRDLYYAPDRIPEEFRQPYQRRGMRPGHSELHPNGGMNLDLANAEAEGGPRNGVMTGLDDFMAEHDRPLRRLVLPVYYGLAVVAEESRLADNPELLALFDHFDSSEGQRETVRLAEQIRLDEAIFTQLWVRSLQQRIDRSADRYLEVVKAALLDDHYLDNEIRIEHLARLVESGAADPDLGPLRDPARLLAPRFERIRQSRIAGQRLGGDHSFAFTPYADMGRAELDHIEASVRRIAEDGVPGDLVEVGVGRGGGAIFCRAVLESLEVTDRTVWVADQFLATRADGDFGADLNQVRDGFDRFGLLDDQVRFLQGPPAETVGAAEMSQLAFVRLGDDLGPALEPTLESLLPRLAPGAVVTVAGTRRAGIAARLDQLRSRFGVSAPLERIGANAISWTMPSDLDAAPERVEAEVVEAADDAPLSLVPPAPSDAVDLSVVVVFYNMKREAPRTLHSLSRAYQRDIDDLSYEVIVIDNGSDPDQRLDAEEVRSFGPEFHLLDMGTHASSSPTVALNAGIGFARGEAIAMMIDGAHVLTPGVFKYAVAAMSIYAPAVVATQQWYVGPGQQGDAKQHGYDQTVEDRLFQRIQWPSDGYRLFEIGHFISERDWFDGMFESNCLFAPRQLIDQYGGFDDAFSMPGGGYSNLDLFERLGLAPGVTPASMLGEGSFHQFHGGTTTNVSNEAERRDRVASYGTHFAELRGRPLTSIDTPLKFVGSLEVRAARRTRSRKGFSLAFDAMRDPVDHLAEEPLPVPDELKMAAIEAVWERQGWKQATWLGHHVNRYPTDLQTCQEMLCDLRPGVVIVAGDDDGLGGRALFAASILDNLGEGHVIAVGRSEIDTRPTHPRITHISGQPETAEVAEEVLRHAKGRGDALVFIALGQDLRVMDAFDHYAPLVPVGGYVVVENTIVNGRPAGAGFGSGPLEAVFKILQANPDFVSDPNLERYTVTFNRDGYLRRMESK